MLKGMHCACDYLFMLLNCRYCSVVRALYWHILMMQTFLDHDESHIHLPLDIKNKNDIYFFF